MKSYMGVAGDYYEKAHSSRHKSQGFFYETREEYMLDFMGLKGNEKIIDVGCGSGTFSRVLAEKHPKAKITGVDISEHAISFARKTAKEKNIGNLKFISASISSIPVKSGSFDVAVVSHLIEHVKNPENDLKEVNRILKPNGILILTTPNYFSLWPLAEMVFDRTMAEKNYSLDEQHISRFTSFSIKKPINNKGFAILREKTLYIFSLEASLLSRRLGQAIFAIDKLLDFLPIGMVVYLKARKITNL
ncbi:MAG TPA: class I SAM-dependent methyltransferase [archaeon]|nr:class I SAM-dependent methyltransferase [archaeon]